MNSGNWKKFLKKLDRIRMVRRSGLFLTAVLRMSGFAVSVLLVYGVLDWLLVLSPIFRFVLDILLLIVIAVLFIYNLIKELNESRAKTAKMLDYVAGNSRQEILSAYELGKRPDTGNELTAFLVGKVVEVGNDELAKLRPKQYFPGGKVFSAFKLFILQLVVFAGAFMINTTASDIILRRIFTPMRDIPPYSCLKFNIAPAEAVVVYGGKLELTATVTGGKVRAPVVFLTRTIDGEEYESPCFRLGEDKFAQKVEQVITPLKFCFKTGRSRSKWRTIKILNQPRISLVKLKVEPPAYSALPVKSSLCSVDQIRELKNSKIALTITSNRPLRSGLLRIIKSNGAEEQTVKGQVTGQYAVTFGWKVTEPAMLEFTIRDIQGTRCRKPLEIKQLVQPDQLPEISIREPDNFVMATPESVVKFDLNAADDLGVRKVNMVRSLTGYRERVKTIAESYGGKDFNRDFNIDFGNLGLSPGDIIEVYFEAYDYNPALTGSASSGSVKIKFISAKEYAEILRNRSSIRELKARYELMTIKMHELNKALQEFKKALADPKISEVDKKRHLGEIRKRLEEATKVFRKFAEDFLIYDIEFKHREKIVKILKKFMKAEGILDTMNPSDSNSDLLKKLAELMKDSRSSVKETDMLQKDAEILAKLDEFLRLGAEFKAIVESQKELVKRLSIFKTSDLPEHLAKLPGYAKQEKTISDRLEALLKKMLALKKGLPEELEKIQSDIQFFTEEYRRTKIDFLLAQTIKQAGFRNGGQAYHFALLAHEKLEDLLNKKKNSFSAAARGQLPGDALPGGMKGTAQQMLESLLNQLGQGGLNGRGLSGTGSGIGPPGEGNSGRSGMPYLNVPVVGPKRLMTGKSGSGGRGRGKGGKGHGIKRPIRVKYSEKMNMTKPEFTETDSIILDQVPPRYRDAVKEYFGGKP